MIHIVCIIEFKKQVIWFFQLFLPFSDQLSRIDIINILIVEFRFSYSFKDIVINFYSEGFKLFWNI